MQTLTHALLILDAIFAGALICFIPWMAYKLFMIWGRAPMNAL